MVKRYALVAAALLAGLAPAAAATDPPPGGALTTGVFKYVGTRAATIARPPVMMLQVVPKAGGSQVDIAIPNNNPDAKTPDPNTAAMNIIRDLKPGDLVKVRYNRSQTPRTLDLIEKYTPKPGDDDPEAIEFVRLTEVKISDQDFQGVLTRKGTKPQTFLVPNKKNDQGKMIPDEEILSQARQFTEGDYVDVEVTRADGNAYIRSIRPYQSPKSAVFVKTSTVKTEADASMTTVELKSDEKAILLQVRPVAAGGPPNPAMVARLRGFRATQAVLYKSVEEGGKEWLTDIRLAAADQPKGDVTLNGKYTFGAETNVIKAVLKPSGPNEWQATYFFNRGGNQTFTGTVKGNLQNGEVTGTGNGAGRFFGFKGKANGGVINLNHYEIVGGRQSDTGTATLSQSPSAR